MATLLKSDKSGTKLSTQLDNWANEISKKIDNAKDEKVKAQLIAELKTVGKFIKTILDKVS